MLDFGFKLGRKLLPGDVYTALQKTVGRKKIYFNQDHFLNIVAQYRRMTDFTAKTVLEFGQANEIATAVLMVLYGAERVYLVDKVNMYTSHGSKNSREYIARILEAFPEKSARTRLDAAQIESQITFINSYLSEDVTTLIPPGTVDCILSNHVLEHVENIEDIFRTSRKLLRPGGKFCCIVDLSDHTYHFLYKYGFLLRYAPRCRFKHLEYSAKTWATLNDTERLRMNRTLLPRYIEGIRRNGFAIEDVHLTREPAEFRFHPHQDVLGGYKSSDDYVNRVSGFLFSATSVSA
jgi:SAM-dependent methyltransferase